MTAPEDAWPPPEATLIRRAREARGLNHTEAASKIEIQLGARRWRQIEDGWEKRGVTRAVAGDPQLAHMAFVVGVSPEDLEAVDRHEAAEILRMIERRHKSPAPDPTLGELAERVKNDPDLARAVLEILRRGQPPPEPEQSADEGGQMRPESA